MLVMRASHHTASRQLLLQLPFAAIACSLALFIAGCHSDNNDSAAATAAVPANSPAQVSATGVPPPVSDAVQSQIDASRKAQAAAFASHYRSGPTGPVK